MKANSPLLLLLFTFGFSLGCEVPEMEVAEQTTPEEVATAADETPEEEVVDETPDDQPPVTSVPREVTPNDPKRGKKSKAAGGYLGAVGHSRFYAEHKLIFDSIKHALNLYWGEHGEYPKSHEEFMKKIVKFNNIALPELEEGVEYIYDPEDHTLKIYRPGDQGAGQPEGAGADGTDTASTSSQEEAATTQEPTTTPEANNNQEQETSSEEEGAFTSHHFTGAMFRKHAKELKPLFDAINQYKNDNNGLPESHEEFMRVIVQANNIELPELENGMKFIYDPQEKLLRVWEPAE